MTNDVLKSGYISGPRSALEQEVYATILDEQIFSLTHSQTQEQPHVRGSIEHANFKQPRGHYGPRNARHYEHSADKGSFMR